MKKIILCSLLVCLGGVNYAMAEEEYVCESDSICYTRPRSNNIVGGCTEDDAFNSDSCPNAATLQPNASRTMCVHIAKTQGGDPKPSCAATECRDGYLLWLSGGQSMGICHSEEYARKECVKGCGNCGDDKKCVPWLKPTPRTGKIDGAYDDCHCVDKSCEELYAGNQVAIDCCNAGALVATWDGNQCKCTDTSKTWNPATKTCDGNRREEQEEDDVKCTYEFQAAVQCANGAVYAAGYKITFDKSEWQGQEGETDTEKCNNFIKQWKKDLTSTEPVLEAFKNKYCGKVLGVSETDFNEAKSKIAAFVSGAKKNASVWKDAEGNFNGVRLASDLTAGVVLGTVGGVVSGVVIKNKQVEKGFNVLHCAVGGQTVADWGDEFSVGLTR